MATEVVDQIEDTFLSCTICFQHFVKPKALPCLHTFCEGCIRDYVTARYEGAGQFPCPVCRQMIYMPPNGVMGFPDNHFIVSLKDTVDWQSQHSPNRSEESDRFTYVSEKIPILSENHPVAYMPQHSASPNTTIGHFGMDVEGFVHVSGMAISFVTDDIVIADCSLNKIIIYSLHGQYRGSFVCDCSIRDVCVTRFGTILVSVSRCGSAILREYDFGGKLIGQYGSFYKYDNPFGITITNREKILITSLQNNCIHVFTERKKPSIKFGSRGSGPNHFVLPYYVAVNSRDDIIVADSGNHRIKLHKNDGSFISSFGVQGSKDGQLFYPMGICVDRHDNIYVADANNFRVQMFSQEGVYLATPLRDTHRFGMDVKPTNVVIHNQQLIVALRGTKFAELHVYGWDTSHICRIETNVTSATCCGCFDAFLKKRRKMAYDEI